MKTIGRRMVLAVALAAMAMFAAAAPSRAQSALPQDIQSQLGAVLSGSDEQLFAGIQSLVTTNPALAPAIAAQAAAQRNALAASIAAIAVQAQPSQAAAIAGAVSAAVPASAIAVFNAVAGLAPDQAGAVAAAVTQAVPPSTEEVVAALQLIQTASGGTTSQRQALGDRQGRTLSGNAENPNQTPGAVSTVTGSTS